MLSFVLPFVAACGFSASVASDATVTTTITVGFENGATIADEKSGTVAVAIVLSEASDTEITVQWEIAGGGAQPVDDFTPISPATVRFAPGETRQTIELAIKQDTAEETDESILLVLAAPTGARLTTNAHEVKISANALPRIRFAMPASTADEPTDATLEVSLDVMSSFPITVDFVIASSSTASNADYTLVPATVTFPPGSTMQPIVLDVAQDALDEDPETVVVTLQNATNAIILDTEKTRTHTIADEDPEPNVSFALAASTVSEGGATINVTVTLTPVSGRAVTVPFTLDGGSSATATTDFAVATASPLTFAAGETTKNIAVSIVQDTVDEPNESVVLVLGNATNAGEAAPLTHTLTITDDDQICYGAGASMVCLDSPPSGAVTLSGAISTDGGLCAAAQPTGWLTAQDAACFIIGDTILVNGATTVTGSRPLVLVAGTTVTINAIIDAASHEGGTVGPSSPSALCKAFPTNPSNGAGAGGGAGGSFMSPGGNGGSGAAGTNAGGTAATADAAAPAKLRAGCPGQRGGNAGGGQNGGTPGFGGGAVYVVSGTTMTFSSNGGINVSGAGAGPGGIAAGGSGGGSGGMIQLFATGALTVNNSTKLVANGGGGASGGGAAGGSAGTDPATAAHTTPASGGSGSGGAGDGGDGFAGTTQATAGAPGNSVSGGGGGGGGGGYILSNKSLGNADVSAGLVSAP